MYVQTKNGREFKKSKPQSQYGYSSMFLASVQVYINWL